MSDYIDAIVDAVLESERFAPKIIPMGAHPPLFDSMHPDNDGPWVSRVDIAKRLRSALSLRSDAHTSGEVKDEEDLASDDRWNAGVNYAIERLCEILGVDPKKVNWDAATETLDGDVMSVICNVLVAAYGEEWSSNERDTAIIRSALSLGHPIQGEAVYLRSYLAWAIAQIEVMNDGNELSVSEWAEDAAMFWQAKQMSMGKNIEHLLHDEDASPQPPVREITDEVDYLVWSNEHRAWWRHKSQGYARNILEAGRYTRAEAVDIADKSRNGWELDRRPDEIAVAIADLPAPIRAALAAAMGAGDDQLSGTGRSYEDMLP